MGRQIHSGMASYRGTLRSLQEKLKGTPNSGTSGVVQPHGSDCKDSVLLLQHYQSINRWIELQESPLIGNNGVTYAGVSGYSEYSGLMGRV